MFIFGILNITIEIHGKKKLLGPIVRAILTTIEILCLGPPKKGLKLKKIERLYKIYYCDIRRQAA